MPTDTLPPEPRTKAIPPLPKPGVGGPAPPLNLLGAIEDLPRAESAGPDRASIGFTRSLALISAATLGTAIIVGLPILFRQQQRLEAALAGGSDAGPTAGQLLDIAWLLLTVIAMAGAGLAVAVLRMLRHAQSQIVLRREVQSMLLRAERARLDADQANADKSRFLAEAGHDLRTPLTTIQGFGEMIEREMLGPIGRVAYRQSAGHIVEAARQLTQRIADIIELSRVEGSIARPAEHPTPVSTMVRETHGWAVTSFAAKGLTVGVRLPEAPVGLKVQPLLLRRILRGLATDAAQRTPAGGAIILSVGFGGDGRLDIAVRDTGATPAMTLTGAVRSYERRTPLLARNEDGGNLGLLIVQALMQSIGGHLEVVDTAGRGSEIHLLFPRHLVVRDPGRVLRRQITD
jgi:signal transduction histidine kinase